MRRLLATLSLLLCALVLATATLPVSAHPRSGRGARLAAGLRSGPTAPSPPAAYWTQFVASSDTRIIYVSNAGNDSNNGLSEGASKATIAAGLALLRDGFPDWLLLKCNDSWSTTFGNFDHAGRSASEPMLVGAYGTGCTARPLIKTGESTGILFTGGTGSTNQYRDYLAFVSLDFYADHRDPDSGTYNAGANQDLEGFTWRQGAHWVLFEDTRFRFFGNGASVHQSSGLTYNIGGFSFRRCQFTDNYTTDGSHAQGIYMDELSADLTSFDECVIDYNGWRAGLYDPDVFSHDMYLDGDPGQGSNPGPHYSVTNSILTRPGSHGCQMRSGQNDTLSGNYVEDTAIGLLFGTTGYAALTGTCNGNTITHPHYIGATPKQYGIWIDLSGGSTVSNNLIVNAFDDQAGSPLFTGIPNVTYTANTIYNWPVGSNMSGSYTDTTRDLAHYDAHLGGPGTFAHAIAQIRAQSKYAWDPNWSTQSIQAWVRAGWNL